MFSEDKVIFNPNNVIAIFLVAVVQELKDFQFHSGLILELLLVPNDLQGNHFLAFVINALQHLAETSRPKGLLDLVAIGNVVSHLCLVIAVVVIVAVVENVHLLKSFNLPDRRNHFCLRIKLLRT